GYRERAARQGRALRAAAIVRSRHGTLDRSAAAHRAAARARSCQSRQKQLPQQQRYASRAGTNGSWTRARLGGDHATPELAVQLSMRGGALVAVADAVDRAVIIVGDQQ